MNRLLILSLSLGINPPTAVAQSTVVPPQATELMPEVQPSAVWRHYNRPRYDLQSMDRSYTPPPENPHKLASFPLAQLSVLGILTAPVPLALIRTPDARTQRVRIGQRLGAERASVTAIDAGGVTLQPSPEAQPIQIPLTATPENQGECRYNALGIRGQLSHVQAMGVIEPNLPELCALWRFLQAEHPDLEDSWELNLTLIQGRVSKPLVHIPQPVPSPSNSWSLMSFEWRQLFSTWQFPPLPGEQKVYFTLHFSPKLADATSSTIVK